MEALTNCHSGQGLQYLGEDDDGNLHWTLEFMTQTMMELKVTALGTEDGKALGDETGTPLIVSPTAA
jgi:hypothetical protein